MDIGLLALALLLSYNESIAVEHVLTHEDVTSPLYERMKRLEDVVQKQQEMIESLLPERRVPNGGYNSFIAFSARVSEKWSYDEYETILFDEVLTNEGSAYNMASGEFTCPYSGLYFIYTRLRGEADIGIVARILKMSGGNDEILASLHPFSPDQFAESSNALVLRLQPGDTVRVIADNEPPRQLYSSRLYNTFTGYLIRMDTTEA